MFVPSFTVKESPKRLAHLRMNDIGLAIQCSTCQTAGVLGPSGSAISISYYELAFRVTHFVCFGDDRVDNQKPVRTPLFETIRTGEEIWRMRAEDIPALLPEAPSLIPSSLISRSGVLSINASQSLIL
jgi:hypothetical protein